MEHVIRILENELLRRKRQQGSPNLENDSPFFIANKKRIEALNKAIKILSNEREMLGKHEQSKKYLCAVSDTTCRFLIPKGSKCDYIHSCKNKRKYD